MLQKLSILVIEDEKSICDFITKTLNAQNYKTTSAHTGKDGLAILTSALPDLVLLDLGLPDMDGLDIIQQTRRWSSLPIIVISARTQEREKVAALDAGADDYITKPFGTDELLARIRTAIRHSNKIMTDSMNNNRPYSAKGLTVDFDKRLVTVDGNEIHLTRVEYKIVSMLAKNSGKVITYSSLIDQVWGPYADDNNRILRVNMANIRRKLEKNPGEPVYIFTELGIGYRMIEDENIE
ncbi:MAG: response regulator [Candidatus Fimisoma sp.]|jgi:two-component system KDP operon response regulator KdpE|nr:response regulator transcription factor [Bacillota bacterium]MDD7285916.1 response regulator transcription factor [Bacillota bacterium]MDY4747559.1 response regulator transcription factor [Candidatus Fimisoma sp.]